MSRSKHKQNAVQWNPPKLAKDAELPFAAQQNVASATQATGLMPRPAQNEDESQNSAALYSTLPPKPVGNIGKGNPQNDESEIRFHRGQKA